MALELMPAAAKEIDTCVHCGLCLSSCPTFQVLGQESDSPRGRIYLVKALQESRLEPDEPLLRHLDLCLGCLACQAACPSGVQYGVILETARHATEPQRQRSPLARWLRRFLLDTLAVPARTRRLARLLRWAQRLRLDRVAGALRLVPGHLAQLARALPELPARSSRELPDLRPSPAAVPAVDPPTPRTPEASHSPAEVATGAAEGSDGSPGLTVGLLLGCVQDAVFSETNAATARLLRRRGCAVEAPEQQACCGALHAHAGDMETARRLARQNIDAFAGVDRVVVNAAGCGAHMKHYDRLLADDPAYAARAQAFAAKVQDLSEILAELPPAAPAGATGTAAAAGTAGAGSTAGAAGTAGHSRPVVTYQDACHLLHGQGIKQQPRDLLGQVADLRELGDATCCGSAGFYNLVEPEMSMELLDRKMEKVRSTGAATVVTGNPGCLLQLRLGAQRAGLDLEVVHIADFLDRAETAAIPGASPPAAGAAPGEDGKGETHRG